VTRAEKAQDELFEMVCVVARAEGMTRAEKVAEIERLTQRVLAWDRLGEAERLLDGAA
jgi:hypothetical protein